MNYNEAKERMAEILQEQHDCNQSTCTAHIAFETGFIATGIDFLVGAGIEGDDEFNALYKKYGKKIQQESNKEVKDFCKQPHIQCPFCNAVIWYPADCDYFCDSCGNTVTKLEEDKDEEI